MKKIFSVRLNEKQHEKLLFLYNLYSIDTEKDSDRFRKLVDVIYSEKMNPSDTPTLSTTDHPQLELLDGWDCNFRAVIYRFNKQSKKREPFVHCSAMNTRRILGTNVIDIVVCKKCHDRGASTNFVSLPVPKKDASISKEKDEFLKRARTNNRKCVKCGTDISGLESWKTLCMSCWRKKQSPAWQSEQKPLRGSPLDQRMRESARIKKMNEQILEE